MLSAGNSPPESLHVDGAVEDESCDDHTSPIPEVKSEEDSSVFGDDIVVSEAASTAWPPTAFDIVGLRKNSRYPWQRDVGVQCNIISGRSSSSDHCPRFSDSSDPYNMKVSSVDSPTGERSSVKSYFRHTVDLFDDHRGPRLRAIKDEWIAKRRSAALTEPDLEYLQYSKPKLVRPKPKLTRLHSAESMLTGDPYRLVNGDYHR